MYYVLFKDEKVVQVLGQSDTEVASLSQKLINDEIDNIIKVQNLDELKNILAAEFFEEEGEPDNEEIVNSLEHWWKDFSTTTEKYINYAMDRVETAGKKDLPELLGNARKAGEELLSELRGLKKK